MDNVVKAGEESLVAFITRDFMNILTMQLRVVMAAIATEHAVNLDELCLCKLRHWDGGRDA